MKKFTQDDYKVLIDLIKGKIEDISRYSYNKYTDLEKLNKDIDELQVIKDKLEERIK